MCERDARGRPAQGRSLAGEIGFNPAGIITAGERRAMSSSPYAPKNGLPPTLLSVVAFLDVLGFKEEIREATKRAEADALLRRFSTAIRRWTAALRREADVGEKLPRLWELKAFTDNLVIAHPVR